MSKVPLPKVPLSPRVPLPEVRSVMVDFHPHPSAAPMPVPLASMALVPDADGIALLTLERDGGANLVDDALIGALGAVLASVEARDDVRGLVIVSSKPHFLLGRDPAALRALAESAPAASEAEVAARLRPYAALLHHLASSAKPVIAALNGPALGAGLELALACTMRLAADDPRLRLGFPDVRIGFMPMAGGTQRLPRLIGGEAAAALLLEGRTLSGEQALEIGLVDGLVAPENLVEAARQCLRQILEEGWPDRPPATPAPPVAALSAVLTGSRAAPRAIATALAAGAALPLDAALEEESREAVRLLRRGEAAVLLRALVLGKAAADHAPWRPNLPTAELASVLILGPGGPGSRADTLRRLLTTAGLKVHMAGNAGDLLALDDIRVEVVLDVTTGAVAARAAVLAVVERVLGDDVLIALTGAADGVAELAAGLSWADRVVGLYLPPAGPWAPSGVAEVVATGHTSAPARSIAVDLARRLGRTPFAIADGGPRYLARLQAAYLRGALDLAARGRGRAAIEAAAQAAGMAESPLTLARRLGLDGVTALLHRGEAARLLDVLKSADGAAGGPAGHDPAADAAPLLAPLRHVAGQAVTSGLVPDAQAADLAAILGLGWPAETGGPLGSFADADRR